MPRRFSRKKRSTRKRRSRKRRGPKLETLIKNRIVTKLKYVDIVTVDSAAASIASHVFRANDAFDPDLTGGGHSPLGYNQYALLYNNKRVLSSTIKITPIHMDLADATPCVFGVYTDVDSTISYGSGIEIIEDMRNKGGWGIAGATDSQQANSLSNSKRASFNVRQMGPEHRNNVTDVAGTPGIPDTRYYQVWASGVTATDNPSPQDFLVELMYTIEFTSPKHLAQS